MKDLSKLREELIGFVGLTEALSIEAQEKKLPPLCPAEGAWKAVARIDTLPSSRIDCHSSSEERRDWLRCFIEANTNQSPLHLSLGGYGSAGWLQVGSNSIPEAISEFWVVSGFQDLLLSWPSSEMVIGVTEEEYTYEIRKIVLPFPKNEEATEDSS